MDVVPSANVSVETDVADSGEKENVLAVAGCTEAV